VLPKFLRRWLRGGPSATPSVLDAIRATAFSDDLSDIQRATELAAMALKEQKRADAEQACAAKSAAAIAKAVKEQGIWLPPSHQGERWR
jgi:hypothetical protein